MAADHLQDFDPYAVISSCLQSGWTVERDVGGAANILHGHRKRFVGAVVWSKEKPWKCFPLDEYGQALGPAVSPSEAAERVARNHLSREAAHA